MSEFVVLDVGHGNSTIVRDNDTVAVVDAPIKTLLLDTLMDMEIDRVHCAFVSHADSDHLAGVLALLTSERVHLDHLYLNTDAPRRTKIWSDFLAAAEVAVKQRGCTIHAALNATDPGQVSIGEVTIDVVAPSAVFAARGVGGKTADERSITANSLSAVLKVSENGDAGTLLAGDLDEIGLESAMADGADLRANVLVFPHHGGSPGADPKSFAARLLSEVKPRSVIFSNGRNKHDNPKQEIVGATVEAGCSVFCTQLANRCCSKSLDFGREDLESLRSLGRDRGVCCAGSMTIDLAGGASRHDNHAERHSQFVADHVPSPMCRP